MPAVLPRQGQRADVRAAVLRVNEIFYSIQGESSRVGLPTVFVRLTGCPLRCRYCDTAYAFDEGADMTIAEILGRVRGWSARHLTVTGGEPLAQRNCPALLALLCDEGYEVSLETGGALDVSTVDPRVMKVLDIKTPGSGEEAKNRLSNLDHLRRGDQIKFVICNRADYEWATRLLRARKLHEVCEVLYSPSHDQLPAATLAEWILADALPVRFQVQLHKYLWGDVRGR